MVLEWDCKWYWNGTVSGTGMGLKVVLEWDCVTGMGL